MKLRIIDGVEVHSSSGNVYADLGLADAEQLKIKTDLVIAIRKASQRGKLISEVLFEPTPPEPAAYIAAAQKVFRSVFFIAVQKMIKEQGTSPGYLQQIMDIPMSDAATLHRELSHWVWVRLVLSQAAAKQ